MMKTEDILRFQAEHELMLRVLGNFLLVAMFPVRQKTAQKNLLVKQVTIEKLVSEIVRERRSRAQDVR